MANNYLQFSFKIDNVTDAEAQWIKNYLENARKVVYDAAPEVTAASKPADSFLEAALERSSLGFDWVLEPTIEGPFLWLYTEESGDPDLAAEFVRLFLKAHRPKQFVAFTWAETCSKMRLDEFSGGGAVVTAANVMMQSAYWYTNKHTKRLRKKGLKAAA